jgi:hypothetical protein
MVFHFSSHRNKTWQCHTSQEKLRNLETVLLICGICFIILCSTADKKIFVRELG